MGQCRSGPLVALHHYVGVSIRQLARVLVLVLVLHTGAPLRALAQSRSTQNLNAIADDYSLALDRRLTRPNFSPQANAAWMKKLDHFSRRLSHIKTKNLDQQSRITFRMLRDDLRAQREYLTNGWARRDINGTESPLHSIVNSVDPSTLRTVNDWRWAIKTLRHSSRFVDSYTAVLEKGIKELHPYEVPEILAVPVVAGNKTYLEWLDKETAAHMLQP